MSSVLSANQYAGPVFDTSSVLSDVVEAMVDWDVACSDQARALSSSASQPTDCTLSCITAHPRAVPGNSEPDKTSRKPIDYALDQIEAQSKRLQSERKELEKDAFAALERHDTPAEQFRILAARSDEISASVGRDLFDLRFALRSQLSEEQWRRLFPPSTMPAAR